MTEPDSHPSEQPSLSSERGDSAPAHKRPQPQSTTQLLSQGTRLYLKHWQPFTKVLLWPILQIYLGIYVSQVLTLALIDWMNACCQPFVSENWWVPLTAILLVLLASVSLIFRGSWQYLIYWASLCINTWEAMEGQFVDFQTAFNQFIWQKQTAYTMLIFTYFALPLVTLLPAILLGLLGLLIGPQMLELLLLVGIVQSTLLMVCWLISLVGLSFVFQISAFEKGIPIDPRHTFLYSVKLVLKRFGTTVKLQLLVYLLTNLIIPFPLVLVCRLLHLSQPLDALHLWILQKTLSGTPDLWQQIPFVDFLPVPVTQLNSLLAQGLTDMALGILITLLLLPFGTILFTLLYKDILKCDRSKKTILGI